MDEGGVSRQEIVSNGERVQGLVGRLLNAMANIINKTPQVSPEQAERAHQTAQQLEKTSQKLPRK